jgi:hypothetical protein
MQRENTGTDWVFVGGITLAIASTVSFATIAIYVLMNAPR